MPNDPMKPSSNKRKSSSGSPAKPAASKRSTVGKTASAPAVKEEGPSRAAKGGKASRGRAGSKGEALEQSPPESVTPVGKETPLSGRRRSDASKGVRQPTGTKKTGKGSKTTVVTKTDIGFGNTLFIRGQGGGLSWDKGVPLRCNSADEWVWEAPGNSEPVEFKLLINDDTWNQGDNLHAEPGQRLVCHPTF